MKNKKMTYVLGLAVLAVWGLIIYRIFLAAGGSDDNPIPVQSKVVNEAYNDYALPKDTAHLLLNYRDPFAAAKEKDTAEIPVKKLISDKLPQAQAKPVNWNFIKYSGYIRNPGAKNLVALVNINGKPLMMAEGETAEQVKLIKNLEDSIQVNFNGKTAFIKIHSGSL